MCSALALGSIAVNAAESKLDDEQQSVADFLHLSKPSGGRIGQRAVKLLAKACSDQEQFFRTAKVGMKLLQTSMSAFESPREFRALMQKHAEFAAFFDININDPDSGRMAMGALHIAAAMFQGMPATIDDVATQTRTDPRDWDAATIEQVTGWCSFV